MTSYRLALFCAVTLPLVAGGVRAWSALPFALVAFAALALFAWQTQEVRITPILWPLLLTAVGGTLLVVPLPEPLGRVLSPSYDELRRFVWELLGADAPRWAPTALNPAVQALDAVRAWSTLALALVISDRAQKRLSTHEVFLAIAGCAVLQAIFALSMGPSDDTRALVLSTFINKNHQAAFFNIAWACALAAYALSRGGASRALSMAAFAISVLGVIGSLSRAGIAAGAIGAAVFAVFVLRGERLSRGRIGALVLAGALVVALSAFWFSGNIAERMASRAEEKTRIWTPAVSLAGLYPVGTGRGGFGLAFNAVREPDRERGQWDYAENEYLQALVDYGPLFGSLGIACLLSVLGYVVSYAWRAHAVGRSRVRRAAVAAMVVMLAAHALFDFNWELLGVSLPCWLALATVGRDGRKLSPVLLGLGAVACVPLLFFGLRHDPSRADARMLVRDRPLDSWAMVQLAHGSLAARDAKTAIGWLNRAVLVDRDSAQPHLLLAEIFCRSGMKAQGRAEARQALHRLSGDHARVFAVIDLCIERDEDALDFCDDGAAPWLSALLERWQKNDARMLLLGRRIESQDPEVLAPLLAAAQRRRDEQLWRALSRIEHPIVWLARADKLIAEGNREGALLWLRRAAEAHAKNAPERYVDALIASDQLDTAEEATELLAKDCEGACRSLHITRARVFSARGKHSQALFELKLVLTSNARDVPAALLAADEMVALDEKAAALALIDDTAQLVPDKRLDEKKAALGK